MNVVHERFNREVWVFKDDFVGSLAKWLVKLSPYIIPDNFEKCVIEFDEYISKYFYFDCNGTIEVQLHGLSDTIESILEDIPEIMALNERKNGREGNGYLSRYDSNPDHDDFIDIGALANRIVCDFADDADAQCWLDSNKKSSIFYYIKDCICDIFRKY